jgi:hypothetical protein
MLWDSGWAERAPIPLLMTMRLGKLLELFFSTKEEMSWQLPKARSMNAALHPVISLPSSSF